MAGERSSIDWPLAVQSLIALAIVITFCIMFATGQIVSDVFLALGSTVIGHYFGGRMPISGASQAAQAYRRMQQ